MTRDDFKVAYDTGGQGDQGIGLHIVCPAGCSFGWQGWRPTTSGRLSEVHEIIDAHIATVPHIAIATPPAHRSPT